MGLDRCSRLVGELFSLSRVDQLQAPYNRTHQPCILLKAGLGLAGEKGHCDECSPRSVRRTEKG
jgi:hypothetical protein